MSRNNISNELMFCPDKQRYCEKTKITIVSYYIGTKVSGCDSSLKNFLKIMKTVIKCVGLQKSKTRALCLFQTLLYIIIWTTASSWRQCNRTERVVILVKHKS